MGTLKIKEEISREVKMTNESDENRRYDIEGTVRLSYGEVVDVSSITAKVGARVIANARTGSGNANAHNPGGIVINTMNDGLTGTFYGDAENTNSVIMAEIESFVADVKAYDFNSESADNA